MTNLGEYSPYIELDRTIRAHVMTEKISDEHARMLVADLADKSRQDQQKIINELFSPEFEEKRIKIINQLIILRQHPVATGGGNIIAPPKEKEIKDEDLKSQGRKWVFTSFLPTKPLYDETKVKYLIYQQEICPESKRLHWQGYAQFKSKCGFRTVQKTLDIGRSYVCRQKAQNDLQAIAYCMKTESAIAGTRVELGSKMNPGERKDLKNLKTLIEGGASYLELLEEDYGTAIRLKNGLLFHKQLVDEKRLRRTIKPNVICHFGHITGCGKTWAAEQIDPSSTYKKSDPTVWWPNYNHENVIILDDFREKDWMREVILKLLDNGRFQAQTKGGYVDINSPTIVLTTNDNPMLWDPALKRRVNKWVQMITPYKPDDNADDMIMAAAKMNGCDISTLEHGCVTHANKVEAIAKGDTAKGLDLLNEYMDVTSGSGPKVTTAEIIQRDLDSIRKDFKLTNRCDT